MSSSETNKNKLITEIKLRLGDGMVDVELDPEHYNLAISKAVDVLRSRSDVASEESYVFLSTLVDVQEYSLPAEVLNVRKVYRRGVSSTSTGGTNFDPFDVAFHNMYMVQAGQIGGLAVFDAFAQYKETLGRIFGSEYDFTFNPNTKVLKILRAIKHEEDISVGVYNYVPEEILLNDNYAKPWIADWALAECKMMLGEARSKFPGGLPGPGGAVTLNGDALKQESMADKERLLAAINNMEEGNKHLGFVIG